jgi:DNA-binding Xre family transcriptional regulator
MIGVIMPRFKTNLKSLMLKKSVELDRRVTQKEVSDATGLSMPTIGRWYRGEVERVETDTVSKLMEYFGCSFEDLVTYEAG